MAISFPISNAISVTKLPANPSDPNKLKLSSLLSTKFVINILIQLTKKNEIEPFTTPSADYLVLVLCPSQSVNFSRRKPEKSSASSSIINIPKLQMNINSSFFETFSNVSSTFNYPIFNPQRRQ